MLPLLPLMMENCAECTYPISEDISMGLMFAGEGGCESVGAAPCSVLIDTGVQQGPSLYA